MKLGLLALAAIAAVPAHAVTLTVTSLANSGPGSLRDMVLVSAPGDIITFNVTGTIVLNSSINIANAITVLGPGPKQLVVSGNNVDRVFVTSASPLLIAGMTIKDGKVVGANGADGGVGQNGMPGVDAHGGAILNLGNLTLSNCWITAGQVVGGKGGRGGDNPLGAAFTPGKGGDGGAASGGAVYRSAGKVIALRCTFSGNSAVGGDGGDGGNNLNFAVAKAGGKGGNGMISEGGAVYDQSGPWFTNCTFSGNSALGGAGGKGGNTAATAVGGTGGNGGWGYCGAISTFQDLRLVSCTIVLNQGLGGAAGLGGAGSPVGPAGTGGSGWGGGVCGYALAPACLNQIGNTIVAINTATLHPNAIIYFEDWGFNYIGDDDYPGPCIGALTKVGTLLSPLDPQLGPLMQNGGGLPTHAPLPGSPVIDQGSSFGLATDERGAARPYDYASITNSFGDGSDIGAFEAGSTLLGMNQAGPNLVVSWPAAYGDLKLQSATSLEARADWADVRETPVEVDDRLYVTNRMTDPIRFFRLLMR